MQHDAFILIVRLENIADGNIAVRTCCEAVLLKLRKVQEKSTKRKTTTAAENQKQKRVGNKM